MWGTKQLKRWLQKRGCAFETTKSGHLKVYRGQRTTILPMHGSGKEIGKGLENAIKKDLGLKE